MSGVWEAKAAKIPGAECWRGKSHTEGSSRDLQVSLTSLPANLSTSVCKKLPMQEKNHQKGAFPELTQGRGHLIFM